MKGNQHEQLFTELTPEEAAVVEGGASFTENIKIDPYDRTRIFNVRPGGTIKLFSNTESALGNRDFGAIIRNVDTNNSNGKIASVGRDTTTWTDIRGGRYVIDFRDSQLVTGNIRVDYT
ncbi:MAG: hypothetical protein KME29_23095 [Calothrix sp. FI2-JRJ7]|jgi:hypothetical protein|nr:hypothetical protein [Calothrix sp. FI2-JRJ7]